mgnify:CR=1 FL=1
MQPTKHRWGRGLAGELAQSIAQFREARCGRGAVDKVEALKAEHHRRVLVHHRRCAGDIPTLFSHEVPEKGHGSAALPIGE